MAVSARAEDHLKDMARLDSHHEVAAILLVADMDEEGHLDRMAVDAVLHQMVGVALCVAE
jgi:hypothetical protein